MRKKASINVLTLKRSYVYVIHVDGVVRYIGKGSNGRMYAHMKEVKLRLTRKFNLQSISPPFQRKLTEAVMRGAVVEEIVLADNLTSKQAYKVEYRHLKELVYAGKRQQLWNVIPHTIYTPEEYKAYVSRLIQNLTSKDRWIRYFSHNHLMRLGITNMGMSARIPTIWDANQRPPRPPRQLEVWRACGSRPALSPPGLNSSIEHRPGSRPDTWD
jgi:hypothetical protein